MKTMVQDPLNEYDIDDGIYFTLEGLLNSQGKPMSASEARKMIRDIMDDKGFKTPPEVRENCVRIYYEKGFHVDLPIYLKVKTVNKVNFII